jgi:hypothetical protein
MEPEDIEFTRTPADAALAEVIGEISVPIEVLTEGKKRRDLVLRLAERHPAARKGAGFGSGSVAHGTTNRPLEDADCGIKVNRRYEAFRSFGPDADTDRGPEAFIQLFSEFILPGLREHYPRAEVDLTGNRAIKFILNDPITIDEWGVVDPYVELIVGLDRVDAPGLWIPNRRRQGWDSADPELHTEMLTERGEKELRVLRAHVIRLAKRAVKRDGAEGGVSVMCSWNLSALALELVAESTPLAAALLVFLRGASRSIAASLTEDPAPAVIEPIALPDEVSREQAALRLEEMARVVEAARRAETKEGARRELEALYGPEIEGILKRESRRLAQALKSTGTLATAAPVIARPRKVTRSGGA